MNVYYIHFNNNTFSSTYLLHVKNLMSFITTVVIIVSRTCDWVHAVIRYILYCEQSEHITVESKQTPRKNNKN